MAMTPEEFAAKARSIIEEHRVADPEKSGITHDTKGLIRIHEDTDRLMAEVLDDLGYAEGLNLLWEFERWYA